MKRTFISSIVFSLPLVGQTAIADDGGLSSAQTSYTGATMLVGDEDLTFLGVEEGSTSTFEEGELTTYGYFAGNTLYAGVEDVDGNAVDAIVEFFWFSVYAFRTLLYI